jgi:hypothetical protein
MPYGLHWEWRGFGQLAPSLRSTLDGLKTKYPEPQRVTDEYLWVPGCDINVKFRTKNDVQSLKFKHLHRVDDTLGTELWLEDPAEEYQLPVAPVTVRRMMDALGLRLPIPEHTRSRAELLTLLAAARVRVVTVEKLRRQYVYDPGADGVPIIVEWAQVLSPEPIDSIAIESDIDLQDSSSAQEIQRAGAAVARTRDSLGAAVLGQLSYLEALAFWARGERILAPFPATP